MWVEKLFIHFSTHKFINFQRNAKTPSIDVVLTAQLLGSDCRMGHLMPYIGYIPHNYRQQHRHPSHDTQRELR